MIKKKILLLIIIIFISFLIGAIIFMINNDWHLRIFENTNIKEIDGRKYFTGLVRDLMRIKTGFKTNEFMIDNPDRFGEDSEFTALSDEELKKIDDKIGYTYNRYVYGRFY